MLLNGCANSKQPLLVSNAENQPRVVRVSFVGHRGSFQMRVNQQQIQKFGNTNFADLMIQLNLGYGDIVVWADQRDKSGKELSQPDDISKWWFQYLKKAKASSYSMPVDTRFFSTPIYHWLAPFEKPRPLTEATFFVDGDLLGHGQGGFKKMIEEIEGKSGEVLIFAPRIKNEGQASPWIAQGQLVTWSKDAGLDSRFDKLFTSRVVEFTDFARFMDDDYD
jgi:hypothetical protein